MTKAPRIIMEMTKDDLITFITEKNANVVLFGCNSGSNYSNCMNS